MKILVLSDTHGHINTLCKIVEKEKDCDSVIFLGDGLQDMHILQALLPNVKINKVCGNCDFENDAPKKIIMPIGKVRALITHGHLYHVKSGLEHIIADAKNENVNLVIFGHTHRALNAQIDNIHLFNPGTISVFGNASYGIITVAKGKVYSTIKRI